MNDSATLQTQQRRLQQGIDARSTPVGLLHEPAALGLDIYQQAYRARLLAALRDNFTVLQRALGDAEFDALGLAYLQARPSRQPSIRCFGDQLAAFMATDYADALPHASLADFARMDWALRAAFDAAPAPLLTPAELMRVPPADWAGLVFELHPTVQLLKLDWAIEPAWSALRAFDPETAAPDQPAPELPEPVPLPHVLLIWRERWDTRWRSLDPLEAELLHALAAGQSFAGICALAAQQQGPDAGTAPARVVQALQRWLTQGLLCRFFAPRA